MNYAQSHFYRLYRLPLIFLKNDFCKKKFSRYFSIQWTCGNPRNPSVQCTRLNKIKWPIFGKLAKKEKFWITDQNGQFGKVGKMTLVNFAKNGQFWKNRQKWPFFQQEQNLVNIWRLFLLINIYSQRNKVWS